MGPIPVVCVGNVVLGGAGKTPTVELVCNLLREKFQNPHILTAGYGGYLKNVVRVDPKLHSYLQVGDEALLSAVVAPTWIGRNRVNSGKAAVSCGADVLVMDDGFQNNSLEKDLKILVVDSKQAFGNGHLFPAGALRETPVTGIKKSDIVLIIGDKGYPLKFKKTLLDCGYDLVDFVSFSDHHPYTITEIQKLITGAKSVDATLITTQKDFVKIPAVFKNEISVINIKLVPENDDFRQKILAQLM